MLDPKLQPLSAGARKRPRSHCNAAPTNTRVHAQVADEASWRVIGAIPYAPFTTRTDEGNITTRWLTQEAHVPFKLSLLGDGGGSGGGSVAQA